VGWLNTTLGETVPQISTPYSVLAGWVRKQQPYDRSLSSASLRTVDSSQELELEEGTHHAFHFCSADKVGGMFNWRETTLEQGQLDWPTEKLRFCATVRERGSTVLT
jgi:hypothetical protein